MSATVTPTEANVLSALGGFLAGILAAGTPILVGQANRTAEPAAADFVVMTSVLRERLATNLVTFSDGGLVIPPGPGIRAAMQPTRITVQLDVHGPNGADNAQAITTLLRDDYACLVLAAALPTLAPLYAADPRQVPFLNGEAQYEDRWIIDAVLQADITVSTPMQFAAQLVVGIVSVDEKYPPA